MLKQELDDTLWKSLINDIHRQRCILLLGPSLATTKVGEKDQPVAGQLASFLAGELDKKDIDYDKAHEQDLEYIAQRYLEMPFTREIDLKEKASNYIIEHTREVPDVYRRLASLPFQFVINTTPDRYLINSLKLENKDPVFFFYNYERNSKPEVPDFSPNKPLVYNLLGSIDDMRSLVLTEAQQVIFIKNILQGNPPIPSRILEHIKPPGNSPELSYLFLGFDFDRWQFRVLLDSLEIHPDSHSFAPKTPFYIPERRTVEYFQSRFKFFFVEEEENQFIGELLKRYNDLYGESAPPSKVTEVSKARKIFISFARQDQSLCDELVKAFHQMVKNKEVEIWHPGLIAHGDISVQIEERIGEAEIILPILSMNYLADDEIFEREVKVAMERQKKDHHLIITPILYKPCDWAESPFFQHSILPANREPIESTIWGKPAFAINEVLKDLKKIIRN